jgi:hypothetical protein
MENKLYDMVAFHVPKHKSIAYKSFLTEPQLIEWLKNVLKDGANVVSIREVEQEKGILEG